MSPRVLRLDTFDKAIDIINPYKNNKATNMDNNLPELIANKFGQMHYENSIKHSLEGSHTTLFIQQDHRVVIGYRHKGKNPFTNKRYTTQDEFESQVAKLKYQMIRDAQMMQEHESERNDIRQSMKVGDVFWGDQCKQNPEIKFFQLVSITGRYFCFRQIKSKKNQKTNKATNLNTYQGSVIPLVGSFEGDIIHKKRFPKFGNFYINEQAIQPLEYTLSPITGSRIYQSKAFRIFD